MMVVLMAALLAAPCFAPPIDAPITDPFRMPACEYCPGNRGIEYGPSSGQPVWSVAAGEVVFAGSVAGTRWVVIAHSGGLVGSYGRLRTIAVSRGDVVPSGRIVGTSGGEFYFGLRDQDRPVDPTSMLGVIRFRTRLVPAGGHGRRPVGPGRLVCLNVETER